MTLPLSQLLLSASTPPLEARREASLRERPLSRSENKLEAGTPASALLRGCLVLAGWATLLAAVGVAPSAAQVSSFSAIGEVPESDGSRKDDLEEAVEDARWSFGNTKVDPFIGLTNGGWIQDVFDRGDRESVNDFTLTLAAGLTLFHQIGEHSTFSLWGLPEYVWWQELEDRRRLNGRYGAGWYGYFSRFSIELEARREEQQQQTTPEIRELTSQRQDGVQVSTAFVLYKSLSLTLNASSKEFESLIEQGVLGAGSPFSRLDRQEDVLQLGLRMRLRDTVDLELGVFDVQTEFPLANSLLDNEGDGVFLGVLFERDRLSWDTRIEQRRAETSRRTGPPVDGSFPELDDTFGHSAVTITSRNQRRGFGFYGQRGLFYSLGSDFAYLLDDTLGVWWSTDFGTKTNLRLWAENSQLQFKPLVGREELSREDELDRYGATFTIELPYGLDLQVGWQEQSVTTIPFNPAAGQRDTSALTIGLGFRAVQWP